MTRRRSQAWGGGTYSAILGITTDVTGPVAAGELAYITGASMYLSRQFVEDVGLFDESFFIYMEDVDLCQRALVARLGACGRGRERRLPQGRPDDQRRCRRTFDHRRPPARQGRRDLHRQARGPGRSSSRRRSGWRGWSLRRSSAGSSARSRGSPAASSRGSDRTARRGGPQASRRSRASLDPARRSSREGSSSTAAGSDSGGAGRVTELLLRELQASPPPGDWTLWGDGDRAGAVRLARRDRGGGGQPASAQRPARALPHPARRRHRLPAPDPAAATRALGHGDPRHDPAATRRQPGMPAREAQRSSTDGRCSRPTCSPSRRSPGRRIVEDLGVAPDRVSVHDPPAGPGAGPAHRRAARHARSGGPAALRRPLRAAQEPRPARARVPDGPVRPRGRHASPRRRRNGRGRSPSRARGTGSRCGASAPKRSSTGCLRQAARSSSPRSRRDSACRRTRRSRRACPSP